MTLDNETRADLEAAFRAEIAEYEKWAMSGAQPEPGPGAAHIIAKGYLARIRAHQRAGEDIPAGLPVPPDEWISAAADEAPEVE